MADAMIRGKRKRTKTAVLSEEEETLNFDDGLDLNQEPSDLDEYETAEAEDAVLESTLENL